MEEEKTAVIRALQDPKNRFLLNMINLRVSKDNIFSEQARLQGNALFKQRMHNLEVHEETWQKYSMSIAVALKNSEMQALAYANRSAFLMHLSKYKEALEDVNRAIAITNSNDLKFKWLCRKVKCLSLIKSPDTKKALHEAKSCFSLIVDKRGLSKLMNETEKLATDGKISNEKNELDRARIEKKTDDFSSVTARCDSVKYGRYLVTAKDIQPGEVIFVEKPYVSCLNLYRAHAYCSHCFVICWNMIPCDWCSWCMFCSDDCKTEACRQYHDIECPGFGHCLRKEFEKYDDYLLTSLRLVIKEVKKVGSISNLKDLVLSAAKSKGNSLKYFVSNNTSLQSHGLKSILSLNSDVKPMMANEFLSISLRVLVSLAKYTQFFGKKFDNDEVDNLISNEDVIFIGSLIFKLLKISYVCGNQIVNNSIFLQNRQTRANSYLERGFCISIMSSLINHNCDPNVFKCFTEDNLLVVYALKPIKKNKQLFYCYVDNFAVIAKVIRQSALNFNCECEACMGNWQPLIFTSKNLLLNNEKEFIRRLLKKPLEKELYKKHEAVIKNILIRNDNFVYTNEIIHDLAKSVEVATQKLTRPSVLTCLLVEALRIAFERVYAGCLRIPSSP